ncbi:MAG: hypothetical protein U1E78_03655 [Gammaproteobacteria bacterium]
MDKDINELKNNLRESIKLINSVGAAQFAKRMASRKSEIEQLIHADSFFTSEENVKLIIDYAIILNAFHAKERDLQKSNDEYHAHLLSACFSVGFAMGKGVDCISALPMMALSGAHSGYGKAVIEQYFKDNE